MKAITKQLLSLVVFTLTTCTATSIYSMEHYDEIKDLSNKEKIEELYWFCCGDENSANNMRTLYMLVGLNRLLETDSSLNYVIDSNSYPDHLPSINQKVVYLISEKQHDEELKIKSEQIHRRHLRGDEPDSSDDEYDSVFEYLDGESEEDA